jgi:hypothetical protein
LHDLAPGPDLVGSEQHIHMRSVMKLIVSSICLVAACGGSDLDPGSGDDPGGGTSTLVVDGRVSAEARFVNARTSAELDTDFSVEVTLKACS